VSLAQVDTIRVGDQRARTSPWRGHREVALITPAPGAPLLSGEFVRHCTETLASRGYQRAVTGALSPLEQAGFLAAGFSVEETLVLLRIGLGTSLEAVPAGLSLRRVPRWRRPEVLAVDGAAFSEFWRFDGLGLADALRATPAVSFKMAVGPRRRVAGYSICGLAGPRGFVQRLAVRPEAQGRGTGRRLLLDGLHWMRRRGVDHAFVNTQKTNEPALRLYRSVGFNEEPIGLSVLSVGLA